VTGDELALLITDGSVQVLDVRTAAEYDGSGGYPCDPRQGHIPGAINIDVAELMGAGASAPDLLRERGVDPAARVVCYCHSGARSGQATALLLATGVTAENHEGSWHEWSQRDS
jgi:thiosulfate/3-mercaptopyruvate sulfurtransferase